MSHKNKRHPKYRRCATHHHACDCRDAACKEALEVADECLALIEDVGHGAHMDNVTAARVKIQAALALFPSTPPPFVFLDAASRPYLVLNGWLRYQTGDKKWVTLRELKPGEYALLGSRKLPDAEADLYMGSYGGDDNHKQQS